MKRCKATTGTTFRIDGVINFQCQLPAKPAHEWHERTEPPVVTRWRELEGGGREYASANIGGSPVIDLRMPDDWTGGRVVEIRGETRSPWTEPT